MSAVELDAVRRRIDFEVCCQALALNFTAIAYLRISKLMLVPVHPYVLALA